MALHISGKTCGTGGVDILKPAVLTGVPLLLWLLRKPVDKILLPSIVHTHPPVPDGV